ncbi:MAG: hypothetical protein KGJ96_03625 [Xanthomonadaceae bacterium]|jgi:vitamin B12 transport system permease protein|nr:hypothetical protein [Xanthomonadaceae bacterium]MDE2247645.1 hypothetical protein [Xanthomonadaceae bacterium]
MSARSAFLSAFALFTATMLGLAAGAAWMVISLYMGRPLPWLAVPIGALLALTIRGTVRRPGLAAMLLSAGATALAVLYLNMLIASVQIAGNMGIGVADAMRTAGLAMLWQLACMALGPVDLLWGVLAMALAGWLAARPPRRR